MKKNLTVSLVITLLLSCNIFAQTTKSITVTITGIEFDDANYTALRDQLKSSQKAKNIQQSYNAPAVKLLLQYNGSATDLWDDLPATIKQPFKLISINANNISLKLKTTTAENNSDMCSIQLTQKIAATVQPVTWICANMTGLKLSRVLHGMELIMMRELIITDVKMVCY